ncbi:MAG TPA: hypothetical protein VFS63_12950 [Pseudolabrys sp.]|jgi:hypothetical protein|nr:hypothetical protein [Pseudolabrys sp.]
MPSGGYSAARLLVLVGACLLAGCTAAAIENVLPPSVGLPADTPVRPAAAYDYPAVHDMPPPRADKPLSEEEQVKLEKELSQVRDRQEGLNAQAKKRAPAAKPKKKPASAPLSLKPTDGAKSNP